MLDQVFEKYFSFFSNKYINKVKNLELAIKTLLVVVAILVIGLIFILLSALNAAADKNINVEVNQHMVADEKYRVTKHEATPSFFLSVAKGLIYEGSSYSAKTIQEKLNFLLSQTHPDAHDYLYIKFKDEVQYVQDNSVTQNFKIKEWVLPKNAAMSSKMTITAVGYLTRTVGGTTVIDNVKYEYFATVGIRNRLPYLVDFGMIDVKKKPMRTKKDEE
jgi:hypothetical protein